MIRSMMQAYVKNSKQAVELYVKAFDANILSEVKEEDGSYVHVELNIFGQVLALSESHEERIVPGNTMQFCLHLGVEDKKYVKSAFEVLQDEEQVLIPMGPCSYSELMVSFIDKFGINWCLFI